MSRLCVRVEEIIPVDQICMGFRGCFNDFGGDIAEIAGEAGELLVGGVEDFCVVKR